MKNKKIAAVVIAVIAVVIVIIAAVIIGGQGSNNADNAGNGTNMTEGASVTADPNDNTRVTMTLFYSANDEEHEQTMAAVEELKAQYGDTVVFDLKDIDSEETQQIVSNMPFLQGATPAVLMSTGKMAMNCGDKASLESIIEEALAQ